MNLPDEVMNDLLTLYMAGEASPATRELVQAYLKERPVVMERFHRRVLVNAERPAVSPDACARTLRATRRWVLLRLFLLGFALTTLLVPLHPYFWTSRNGKTFVAVAEGTSAAAWCAFAVLGRRIRRVGI